MPEEKKTKKGMLTFALKQDPTATFHASSDDGKTALCGGKIDAWAHPTLFADPDAYNLPPGVPCEKCQAKL